jgi:PAS domain S-box-containing protein
MMSDYRVRQRDYLLRISRALTSQLDLGVVLRLILESAADVLNGHAGLVALREEEGAFTFRASYGIPPALLGSFAPLLHSVPRNGAPAQLQVLHVAGLPENMDLLPGVELGQAIALPMVSEGNVIGTVFIFRPPTDVAFTADDRLVLASFADQATIAVNNAQLYQQVAQEKRRLDAILEFSGDGVLILDAAGRVAVLNRTLARLTGWNAAEAIGQSHDKVIVWGTHPTGMTLAEAETNGWPFDGSPTLYVEGELRRRNGETSYVAITYAPLFDREGRLVNLIANVRDMSHVRAAEELKSTFLSVVSHELKTPVALIKGYASTLAREDARWDPKTLHDSLLVIEEESDRLNNLINDILDTSRLQVGALKLEMGDVQLDKLAESVVAKFQTQTNRHELTTKFPKHFPVVTGDVDRLAQVLNNLVGNAIKYSPRGGQICIGGHVGENEVVLSVSDEGIGISEADQEHIFDRFYRVDSALTRRTQGTGLGLYLTKAIIQAHGGRIWIDSDHGKGTTFRFTLPA